MIHPSRVNPYLRIVMPRLTPARGLLLHSAVTSRNSLFLPRLRRFPAAGALVFLSCGLVACGVGPRYQRPDIAPPTAWRETPEETSAAWPSSDWWRGFNSSALDDLMGQARSANDDIGAAI